MLEHLPLKEEKTISGIKDKPKRNKINYFIPVVFKFLVGIILVALFLLPFHSAYRFQFLYFPDNECHSHGSSHDINQSTTCTYYQHHLLFLDWFCSILVERYTQQALFLYSSMAFFRSFSYFLFNLRVLVIFRIDGATKNVSTTSFFRLLSLFSFYMYNAPAIWKKRLPNRKQCFYRSDLF